MAYRSRAARRHADLAYITFGVSDELGNRASWNRWMHYHNVGLAADGRDRRDVPNKIETEIGVECGVNCIRGANLQKRIAIGGGLHDRFGGGIAGSTRPVLDYELLSKSLRQPLTHEACHDVGSPASRKANDDPHRPRRIALRPTDS